MTLNPGGPFEWSGASPALDDLQVHLYDRISQLAHDSCGEDLTTEEIKRRIIPSLPMLMNLISETPDTTSSCVGKIADGFRGLGPFDAILGGGAMWKLAGLPSTCTYASVASGAGCAFRFEVAADRLPGGSFSIDVAAKQCPGHMLPYFTLRTPVWPLIISPRTKKRHVFMEQIGAQCFFVKMCNSCLCFM